MNVEDESPNRALEVAKWLLSLSIVGAGIAAFYYFAQWLLIFRILLFLALLGISILIASRTNFGILTVGLIKDSIREARKVVWPTRAETMQTTLVVLGMVMLMGVMLWMVDWFLGFILRRLTGMGA
ncbi:MAG: preprotein translocase subunit SecE [Candidatus Macondimonas sp.]